MSEPEARFPESERPKVRRAIADLEEAYIAGRRPDLSHRARFGR